MSEPTIHRTAAEGAPAEGWYPTDRGWRWWDGAAWGPLSPTAGPGAGDERTLALFSHLGGLLGGVVVPLVLYLITRRDKPFARHHAAEALNFQLTALLAVLTSVLVFVAVIGGISGFTSDGLGDGIDHGAEIAIVIMVLMLVASSVGHAVLSVVAAVRASRMEWWRYPVSIRFVKP